MRTGIINGIKSMIRKVATDILRGDGESKYSKIPQHLPAEKPEKDYEAAKNNTRNYSHTLSEEPRTLSAG